MKIITKKYIILFLLIFLTFHQATSTGKLIFSSNATHKYEQHSTKKVYTNDVRFLSTNRSRAYSLVNIYNIVPIIFLSFILTSLLKLREKYCVIKVLLDERIKIKEFTLMYFNCSNYKSKIGKFLLS